MTTPTAHVVDEAISLPIAAESTRGALWLLGTAFLCLMALYFIGIDEGMTSVFGNTTYLHELVHDGRHFLGFPCH